MADYKEIILTWSNKIKLNPENFIQQLENISTDNVLYQIYGDSHIYGRDVLLYIGISINAENRFRTHLKSVFGYVNNVSVSIGQVESDIPNLNLEIPESILIANHKPSMNKEFIHDVSPKAKENNQKYIVINNGSNAMLKTCCTNFWWVDNS